MAKLKKDTPEWAEYQKRAQAALADHPSISAREPTEQDFIREHGALVRRDPNSMSAAGAREALEQLRDRRGSQSDESKWLTEAARESMSSAAFAGLGEAIGSTGRTLRDFVVRPMYNSRTLPGRYALQALETGEVVGPSSGIRRIGSSFSIGDKHGVEFLVTRRASVPGGFANGKVGIHQGGATPLTTDFMDETGKYIGDAAAEKLMAEDFASTVKRGGVVIGQGDSASLGRVLATEERVSTVPFLESKFYGKLPVNDYANHMLIDSSKISPRHIKMLTDAAEKRGIPYSVYDGSAKAREEIVRKYAERLRQSSADWMTDEPAKFDVRQDSKGGEALTAPGDSGQNAPEPAVAGNLSDGDRPMYFFRDPGTGKVTGYGTTFSVVVRNPDDGMHYVVPTIYRGEDGTAKWLGEGVSPEDRDRLGQLALDRFRSTGEHWGAFTSPDDAIEYARKGPHERHQERYMQRWNEFIHENWNDMSDEIRNDPGLAEEHRRRAVRQAAKSDGEHRESTAPTDDQIAEALEFLHTVLEIGAPQNEWEQSMVQRMINELEKRRPGGAQRPGAPVGGTVNADIGGGATDTDRFAARDERYAEREARDAEREARANDNGRMDERAARYAERSGRDDARVERANDDGRLDRRDERYLGHDNYVSDRDRRMAVVGQYRGMDGTYSGRNALTAARQDLSGLPLQSGPDASLKADATGRALVVDGAQSQFAAKLPQGWQYGPDGTPVAENGATPSSARPRSAPRLPAGYRYDPSGTVVRM